MICTLCVASLLTVTSTPDLMDNEIIHGATSEEHLLKETPGEFTRTLEVQGVPIGLVISPFFVGFNNFTVNIPEKIKILHKFLTCSLNLKSMI